MKVANFFLGRVALVVAAMTLSVCVEAESTPILSSADSRAGKSLTIESVETRQKASDVEKYIGTRIESSGGFLIRPKGKHLDVESDIKKLGGTGNIDESGRILFYLVEITPGEESFLVLDVIDVPNGMELGGLPPADDCYLNHNPQETIFVVGKPVDKPSKNGRKYINGKAIGTFINPVFRAWRVDFKDRKFVEIEVKNIHCEISMDIGAD